MRQKKLAFAMSAAVIALISTRANAGGYGGIYTGGYGGGAECEQEQE